MALYFGSDKIKINIADVVLRPLFQLSSPITNSVLLLSSDDFILKDSEGVYLTVKEDN